MTWETLARYLAGESPPDEAEAVRAWLAEDPARVEMLTALDRSVDAAIAGPAAGIDVEAALGRVKARFAKPDVAPVIHLRRRRERGAVPWNTKAFRIAAGLVLVVGATVIWRATQVEPSPRTWAAAIGQADSIRLPDGTFVQLGPDSWLSLAADFGTGSRELELEGEAFFNVVHDAERPFTVHAGDASIVDLGTAFTVRTGAGLPVEVAVTDGSVLLSSAFAPVEEGIVLNAGDRGEVHEDGSVMPYRDTVTEDDLAWLEGRLVFRDATLDRVSADLRRWYGVRMDVSDPELADRTLTATFEGETAEQVLDVIGLTLGARAEWVGDTVYLRF